MPDQTWYYWKTDPLDGAINMAWDDICLSQASTLDHPLLRFYQWAAPSTTFGYFQNYESVETQSPNNKLIRRPTGGGIVPHSNDWTYSLTFPPSATWYRYRAAESYHHLHRWIQSAFSQLDFTTHLNPSTIPEGPGSCFVGAEKDDLMHKGVKLAGAAQRRNRQGFLIQGSIQPPPRSITRSSWEAALMNVATKEWDIKWLEWTPSKELAKQVTKLAKSKYAHPTHTKKR